MPATLNYPGVYIEEVPSGVRTITGVATSITAFIGRAKRGPVNKALKLLPALKPAYPIYSAVLHELGDDWHRDELVWNDLPKPHPVLQVASVMALVDFTADSPMGPPPGERLAPEVVEAELRAAGLAPERVQESLPNQYVVVGRR